MKTLIAICSLALLIFQIACSASVSGPSIPILDALSGNEKPKEEKTATGPMVKSLATTENQACAIVNNQLYCWGSNTKKIVDDLSSLKNLKQVTLENTQACVLHDDGVKCSRRDSTYTPELKNPRQITGAGAHTCALDDNGVQCWGESGPSSNYYNVLTVPKLKNPTLIAAGYLHTCAITDDGIVCWGNPKESQSLVLIEKPRQLAISQYANCALGSKGIECWNGTVGSEAIKKLNSVNPTQLAINDSYYCAIGDGGVTCTSYYDYVISMDPPPFRNPNLISVSTKFACAADADGVKCWGANSEMGKLVPDFGLPKPSPKPASNPALSYAEVASGRCLKSWNWESAASLICVTQGYYSFFNIVNKTPQNFSFDLIGGNGSTTRFAPTSTTTKYGTIYTVSLSSASGSTLKFDGIDFGFASYEPKAGYVIFNGNSGTCAPIISGSRASCLIDIQAQNTYGDSVTLNHFNFPKDTTTFVGNCNLKALDPNQYLARFKITSTSCSIGSTSFAKDDIVTFDLREPSNFPALTLPKK